MKPYISIGRSNSCDIVINHEAISREHARMFINNGLVHFENLGKNGTIVNGRMVMSGILPVAPGTPVILAGYVPLPWPLVMQRLTQPSYDCPPPGYMPPTAPVPPAPYDIIIDPDQYCN